MVQNRLSIFVILLLLMLSNFASGQDFDYHRDFEKILSQSKDKSSSLYYPALLERFHKNDSTLSNSHVLALLIGYTASKDYQPYQTVENEKQILQLVQQKKWEQALAVSNQLLKTNPLNLTALMEKAFVYWKLNHDSLNFYKDQHLKIIDALLYSGNGSFEKPYFVLSPLDGQILIEYVWGGTIGTMGSARDKHGYFLDILEFEKEGRETKMLYFNIAHATARMFSDEKKAEMEDIFEDNDVLSRKKKAKN